MAASQTNGHAVLILIKIISLFEKKLTVELNMIRN